MNFGSVTSIIAIAAVIIFFVWGYLAPGSPSWLIFLVAGLGIVIAKAVMGKNEKKGD